MKYSVEEYNKFTILANIPQFLSTEEAFSDVVEDFFRYNDEIVFAYKPTKKTLPVIFITIYEIR